MSKEMDFPDIINTPNKIAGKFNIPKLVPLRPAFRPWTKQSPGTGA